jgi:hypothetical protein
VRDETVVYVTHGRYVIVYELLLAVIVVRGRPRGHGKVRGVQRFGNERYTLLPARSASGLESESGESSDSVYRLRGPTTAAFCWSNIFVRLFSFVFHTCIIITSIIIYSANVAGTSYSCGVTFLTRIVNMRKTCISKSGVFFLSC